MRHFESIFHPLSTDLRQTCCEICVPRNYADESCSRRRDRLRRRMHCSGGGSSEDQDSAFSLQPLQTGLHSAAAAAVQVAATATATATATAANAAGFGNKRTNPFFPPMLPMMTAPTPPALKLAAGMGPVNTPPNGGNGSAGGGVPMSGPIRQSSSPSPLPSPRSPSPPSSWLKRSVSDDHQERSGRSWSRRRDHQRHLQMQLQLQTHAAVAAALSPSGSPSTSRRARLAGAIMRQQSHLTPNRNNAKRSAAPFQSSFLDAFVLRARERNERCARICSRLLGKAVFLLMGGVVTYIVVVSILTSPRLLP